MEIYRVCAHNTASDSENRIHDDSIAPLYGFRAGLVPGVTVYGYLTVPVIRHFGPDWLTRGGMRVRFMQPVYEGEPVTVQLQGDRVEARGDDGIVCAAGEILWQQPEIPALLQYPEAPMPQERPGASAESLAPGRILGSLHYELSLPDEAFLAAQGETLPLYRQGLMHPAALLALSNQVLLQNVKLGPWIHVASDLQHFSVARNGERLTVRARVDQRFERKGHQFVVLDIVSDVDGRVVQQVRHTAIYEPRRISGTSTIRAPR